MRGFMVFILVGDLLIIWSCALDKKVAIRPISPSRLVVKSHFLEVSRIPFRETAPIRGVDRRGSFIWRDSAINTEEPTVY